MWFHKQLRLFLAAAQFLTIFPIRLKKEINPEEFGKALVYFPVVGLFIGLLLIFIEYIGSFFLPASVLKICLILFLIIITGGLHLDGLADTVDAVASRKKGEDALRLMREGTIGPLGAAAVMISLAVKYLVLMEFFGLKLYAVLLLFPLMGRIGIVTGCFLFSYARNEGTAKFFIGKHNRVGFVIAFVISFIAGAFIMGIRGLFILASIIFVVNVFGRYFTNRFGGITGDSLGFMNECGELVFLIGATVII